MDELFKLLAEKLGIAADASAEWLQTAIPQYAQMMAIQTTFYSVVSVAAVIIAVVALALTIRKCDDDDAMEVGIFACILAIGFFGFIAALTVPDAICWFATPDAMLLKELVGVVK